MNFNLLNHFRGCPRFAARSKNAATTSRRVGDFGRTKFGHHTLSAGHRRRWKLRGIVTNVAGKLGVQQQRH